MVSTLSCVRISQKKSQWHHPLYVANNDYWQQRIPVSIRNNMDRELLCDPLEIKVGKDRGQAPLAGVLAESIRLTTAFGGVPPRAILALLGSGKLTLVFWVTMLADWSVKRQTADLSVV